MGSETPSVILAGLVSGVLSSLLVLAGAKYWRAVVIPWYEDRVYKDVMIAGRWESLGQEHGETFTETVKVRQRAHHVSGEITYRVDDKLIEYQFDGEFKNLILTARYWVKEESNLDRGTFTLMLKNNGQTLKGFYAWYLPEDNDVISGNYEWKRA